MNRFAQHLFSVGKKIGSRDEDNNSRTKSRNSLKPFSMCVCVCVFLIFLLMCGREPLTFFSIIGRCFVFVFEQWFASCKFHCHKCVCVHVCILRRCVMCTLVYVSTRCVRILVVCVLRGGVMCIYKMCVCTFVYISKRCIRFLVVCVLRGLLCVYITRLVCTCMCVLGGGGFIHVLQQWDV